MSNLADAVAQAAPIQVGEAGTEYVAVPDDGLLASIVLDLAIRALEGEMATLAAGLPPSKRPVVGMHMGRVSNEQRIRRSAKNRRCRTRQSEGNGARAGCYDIAGKGGCGHRKHSRPSGKPR